MIEVPPFPALTTEQRWHLDVFGYVVIENMLSNDQVINLKKALNNFRNEFMQLEQPWNTPIRNGIIHGKLNEIKFNNLIEADPSFLEYAIHPRIVGMVQEVIGLGVRICETEAIINSRDKSDKYSGPPRYQWHRARPTSFTYYDNGLFHCTFVKAITNLTDIGEEDGGTAVVAGSHKSMCEEESMIKAVKKDPSLIHNVVAPAGSTLVFCETLLHATAPITSDNERMIMITGYQPWNHRTNTVRELSDSFKKSIPEELEKLVLGSDLNPRLRRRTLGMDPDTQSVSEKMDIWSLDSPQ